MAPNWLYISWFNCLSTQIYPLLFLILWNTTVKYIYTTFVSILFAFNFVSYSTITSGFLLFNFWMTSLALFLNHHTFHIPINIVHSYSFVHIPWNPSGHNLLGCLILRFFQWTGSWPIASTPNLEDQEFLMKVFFL